MKKIIDLSEIQYQFLINEALKNNKSSMLPRSVESDGSIRFVQASDWTSGFFPGCLWLLYQRTKNPHWLEQARHFTELLANEQHNSSNHDLGFKMFCSYGLGYYIGKIDSYLPILYQSAKTLALRFNPKVGAIRSWDHHQDKWDYPVIIDNMMNLELLFFVSRISGDQKFYNIAHSHAKTTLKNHFREDHSTYHVVDYNLSTGKPLHKHTHQGFSHDSTWARGQAWAVHGFAMAYRETRDESFLTKATHAAQWVMNHPRLPADCIPYWDFDDPAIPNAPRDASAGAILCSAFYELAELLGENGRVYGKFAHRMFETLCSPEYLAEPETNGGFLLKHSTGDNNKKDEVDAPLVYGDYYFLNAAGKRIVR
jgi:unsaturated chondroitin disaccharide hydrolase